MEKKSDYKKFSILSLVLMGLSALFTLFLITVHGDISILAFIVAILYLSLTFYFLVISFIKNKQCKHMLASNRLVEFMPYVFFVSFILRRAGQFGTPFWYDVITVVLWFSIFVLSILVSRKLDLKRCKNIIKGWDDQPAENKISGAKKFFFEAGDWIYSIVWAIFSVMLLQVFVIQLYEIPSESMVPTFLVKDRVLVSKVDCGPKFPLTDVGLPTFRKYKRGDTVVLRNPHYSMDRKSEVKTVTSQLVYMLTFMTVNLNTDENGQMKADPLVKRITGLPGEQLVMQDGVLYTRTKDSDDFVPSTIDAKYATWNLNELPRNIYSKVVNPLFSSKDYENILQIEEDRRNLDLDLAAYEIQQLLRDFNRSVRNIKIKGDFVPPSIDESKLLTNVSDISFSIITENGGRQWFTDFVTSWIPSKDNVRDMYSEANYKLNVMTKLLFAKIVVRNAQAFANNDFASLQSDMEYNNYFKQASMLVWYVQGLLDSRNMPVFPANDNLGNPQYIPDNCYFMMGDNRFNSLDLRHAYEPTVKNLTNDDPMSVTYHSLMAPQYINRKYIIGKPVFTFWPFNRMGRV